MSDTILIQVHEVDPVSGKREFVSQFKIATGKKLEVVNENSRYFLRAVDNKVKEVRGE